MNTCSKTKIFFLSLLFIIGVGILYYRLPPSSEENRKVVISSENVSGPQPHTLTDVAPRTQQASSNINAYSPNEVTLTPREIAALKEVYEDSVWINRDTHPYTQYDMSTLKALAENGDTRAMKEIVLRLINSDSRPEEYEKNPGKWLDDYEQYVTMAIIHGDRELLGMGEDFFVAPADPNQSPKDSLLSSLAYSEFMAMRGSIDNKYLHARDVIKAYQQEHGTVQLTHSDKAEIYRRAENIYQKAETMRLDAGFPPFDNRVPTHFQAMQKQYPNLFSEEAMRRRLPGEISF